MGITVANLLVLVLLILLLFRVSASVFSVFFRVIPWLMLLLVLISVAMLLLSWPTVYLKWKEWVKYCVFR